MAPHSSAFPPKPDTTLLDHVPLALEGGILAERWEDARMNQLNDGEPFQPYTLLSAALIPDTILYDPTLGTGARLLWSY
jgi:hypothetical protein